MSEVINIISTVGFPIFACITMGWFVKYQLDKNNEEMQETRESHKQEVEKITEALNNNTLALQKLIDKIEGD